MEQILTNNLIQVYAYVDQIKDVVLIEDYYFDEEYNLYSNRTKGEPKKLKINFHTEKSKPTIIINYLNKQCFTLEDMIIGTFFIKTNKQKIVKDKSYDYLSLLKAGWGIIYKDGNIHNYNPNNMIITSTVGYFKWCQETGHKPMITDMRKDIMLRWAKRNNNTGKGSDIDQMAEHFHLSSKTIRLVMD